LTTLEGFKAPGATHIEISWCNNLVSVAGLDVPNAITIVFSGCFRLMSLEGLNVPKAIAIVALCLELDKEAEEIVAQNTRLRPGGHRGGWCAAVRRGRLALDARIAAANAGAEAELAVAEAEVAGTAGSGSGAAKWQKAQKDQSGPVRRSARLAAKRLQAEGEK
jgi:hypothetical protein